MRVVAQFVQAHADDGNYPDAVFFLGTYGTAYQKLGSILEPFDARSTKTKSFGNW